MRALSFLLLLLLAAVALAPARARAYDDQLGLALGAGYVVIPSDTARPQHGVGSQLELAIGLDDTWELRALSGYAIQIGNDPLQRIHVGAEIVYLVDILELVPFAGIGADFLATFHTGLGGVADFAGHAVLGLDWLLPGTRQWALGLEFRPYLLFTRWAHSPFEMPVWLTGILRAQMLFEM